MTCRETVKDFVISALNLGGFKSINCKETVKDFVTSDQEFHFVKGIFKLEILANVKRLEIPAFFLTLPRADLTWNEIPIIIWKLIEVHFHILSLSYQDHCKALNKN